MAAPDGVSQAAVSSDPPSGPAAAASCHNSARGSLWSRWDLHLHTPSSFDYNDKSVTNEAIVGRLRSEGIRLVAITDHHVMDLERIRALQQLGGAELTVLPGIELRSELGRDPIHYVCIFPESCDLDHVWTTLQGQLGLTPKGLMAKGGDDAVYVPLDEGARAARELGGVVTIHAGAKSNSIENIKNTEEFQRRLKYDVTSKFVDVLEIGQLKDIDRYFKIVFPDTGLEKPLILTSDCHDIADYSFTAPQWFRSDPTFRGLLMVLREPRDRVFIGVVPPDLQRVQQDRTKYIRSVTFIRRKGAPPGERWFSGEVPLNTGLVAVVGNKGSGKSALSDTLGLLGATRNGATFSFLSKERFRDPKSGLAAHFEASLAWESGESVSKGLADPIAPQEVERVKYLPQDHVENVCNELASSGGESFEKELKAVIFSHVPEHERLGNLTLDDLVGFRTGEKQKRIDVLVAQLRTASRSRAALEAQSGPAVKQELEEKIKRREGELEAHGKAKPALVTDPAKAEGGAKPDPKILKELEEEEAAKKTLLASIQDHEQKLRAAERRCAVATRLLEKLDNFKKVYDEFVSTLQEDAKELGLDPASLVTFEFHRDSALKEKHEAAKDSADLKTALDNEEPPGLRQQVALKDQRLAALHQTLDAPNRAYQAYLLAQGEWEARRVALEGDADSPDSLKGLQAALANLGMLPAKIAQARGRERSLALEIHGEKSAQADIYRELYGPVQRFIDSHEIAKDKLQLEFKVELVPEALTDRFLDLIAQNRKGSFMGIDEGRARVEGIVERISWNDASSVGEFLDQVDDALHRDLREEKTPAVQLSDQLMAKRKPEEVYDLLYGLEYVRSRYALRWEGKALSMLSPGERGTLLLVFYLLIDKNDVPLVIDQPEGNLDNYTVSKVLLQCIRAARRRRQVVLVTHNPNLAVVCDADQIIHAVIDKANGNAITYLTGALENPAMSRCVTDVLEGTRWAFDKRGRKYDVSA